MRVETRLRYAGGMTPIERTHPALSDADVAYVTRHYSTLAAICAGRHETPEALRGLMAEGRLPRPTYHLSDGTELVPRDYFDLADAAGGVGSLPVWFADSLRGELAAREMDASADRVAREWREYLSGEYGACLRRVTPANIAEKARLMAAIEGSIARPRPDDEAWRAALRRDVDSLDAMVREFADWDRARFGGPVSRDRLIAAVRARFPAPWAPAPRAARAG
jgi:hypothetical protein